MFTILNKITGPCIADLQVHVFMRSPAFELKSHLKNDENPSHSVQDRIQTSPNHERQVTVTLKHDVNWHVKLSIHTKTNKSLSKSIQDIMKNKNTGT